MSKSARSWNDAQIYCKNEGGNLVSILDAFEQAYVSLVKTGSVNPEWIGLKSVRIRIRKLLMDIFVSGN